MIVVVKIGCLECGNPSDLLGVYTDIPAALAEHPDAKPREEFSDHPSGSGWWGDAQIVAFSWEPND